VRAAVVGGENFNVLVTVAAVEIVFDPEIGKVHPGVEVRQVVFTRPVFDLALVTIGPAVAVRVVAVVLLEKLLILAPQITFEDYAFDLGALVP